MAPSSAESNSNLRNEQPQDQAHSIPAVTPRGSSPARVTRSTARRQAAEQASSSPAEVFQPPQPHYPSPAAAAAAASSTRKKRKAPVEPAQDAAAEPNNVTSPEPVPRRNKRQRTAQTASTSRRRLAATPQVTMSAEGYVQQDPVQADTYVTRQPPDPPRPDASNAPDASTRRKSTKSRKTEQAHDTPSSSRPSTRRTKKGQPKEEEDAPLQEVHSTPETKPARRKHDRRAKQEEEGDHDDSDDMNDAPDDAEDNELMRNSMFGRFASTGGLVGFPRGFGMMAGSGSANSARLKEMLDNLRSPDETTQLFALNELSTFLLVSTEDNLTGHFVPDHFVRELVKLMQPDEITGEERQEQMLVACRCIANLMEALPPATASVVYGGAVPVLCQKLLNIEYIDLAEQALSTLEKISVDFPASIVREGGLTACLTYLDFFATSTQRTAVTTAANCCRNIPEDSFPVVRDVMPVLLNVLGSSDQKVVEQGSLCVSRIAESFKYKHQNLEELMSADLLGAILRLLMPGSTNLIPADVHTKFLRVLAFTARASPDRSAALLKMDIVDTLYQILTGVSPPSSTDDLAFHIDGVVIMQALIRKQREQIYETLNVICELLPGMEGASVLSNVILNASYSSVEAIAAKDLQSKSEDAERRQLLGQHKDKLNRFATILLPTLTHAYTSTVNLGVRQKVLTAQLKMLSNLDVDILKNALRTVPFASHLASILSARDHPILVLLALLAARLLFDRMGDIYAYQFCREGVLSEITKIANRPVHEEKEKGEKGTATGCAMDAPEIEHPDIQIVPQLDGNDDGEQSPDEDAEVEEQIEIEDDGDGEEGEEHDRERMIQEDMSPSPSESTNSEHGRRDLDFAMHLEDIVTLEAKNFLETFEKTKDGKARGEANKVLDNVRAIANDIQECYTSENFNKGSSHFRNLAKYFSGDALQSITSAELLGSDLVDVLLDTFSSPDEAAHASKTAFLSVFMDAKAHGTYQVSGTTNASTPFNALIHKLQDLLSRAEHFEVITVHNNSYDSNRSSAASMLAKQLRLKLVANEESDIPRPYHNIMVSIHAIATFKALDDYLRPRLSLSERPRSIRHTEMLNNIAAAVGISAEARQRLLESGLLGIAPPSMPAQASLESQNQPRRRSGRHTGAASSTPRPVTPPPHPQAESAATRQPTRHHRKSNTGGADTPTQPTEPLECADERQLSDEDDGQDEAVLDPSLEEMAGIDQEGGETPDPNAVNMEVASTGKVTARQDDGTRIPTPSQNSRSGPPPAGTPSQSRVRNGPGASFPGSRAMSYAAATQATPQNWHIEFSIDGQVINNESTIYRAVHYRQNQPEEPAARSLWSAVHPISFKRVPGPPPEPLALSPTPEPSSEAGSGIMPASLHKNPLTSKILRLLQILHEMNSDMDSVLDDQRDRISTKSEPASLFVNTKLTAKLNRQLEEPLIVASSCLPGWSEDLARLYPFLFPFETRHLFLQSTSFGYSRSMSRWQSAQEETARRDRHRDERPFLGRLQRQKVRISRSRILESAMKVMELYGASPSVLEVEYFEEVGTGLGPTLEFYSTVSKEFSKKKIKLWRENESNNSDEYAFGKLGLFPAPMSDSELDTENGRRVLHLFKMMGKFVARAMLDSRIIDISFNPMFFRFSDDTSATALGLTAIKSIDTDLYSSLKTIKQFVTIKKRIDDDPRLSPVQKATKLSRVEVQGATILDMGLDFTLPGYPSIELIPGGTNVTVDIHNVENYLNKVIDFSLGTGVRSQVSAFRAGFSQVFPYSALRAFTPSELVMLFGRTEEDWSVETLIDAIKADHGYNMDSASVRNLLHVMSELDAAQRRDFLQFVTGSPKLPIGGFKSLTPLFTIVCKPAEAPLTSDDFLPSVMTCVNYLKLPDYSNIDVMRSRLSTAIKEGQGAFHLS